MRFRTASCRYPYPASLVEQQEIGRDERERQRDRCSWKTGQQARLDGAVFNAFDPGGGEAERHVEIKQASRAVERPTRPVEQGHHGAGGPGQVRGFDPTGGGRGEHGRGHPRRCHHVRLKRKEKKHQAR